MKRTPASTAFDADYHTGTQALDSDLSTETCPFALDQLHDPESWP